VLLVPSYWLGRRIAAMVAAARGDSNNQRIEARSVESAPV